MQQNPSSPGWQGRRLNTPEIRHRWEKAWTSVQNKEFQAPFRRYRRNLIFLFIASISLWLIFVYLLAYSPKQTPLTLISFKNYQSPVPPNLGASKDESGLGSLANLQFFSENEFETWRDDLESTSNPNKIQVLKIVADTFQEDQSFFFKLPGTRILYINGYAAVNKSDEPCLILTTDNPLNEASWLKIEDLFEEIDQATKSKNFQTLLVFDCVKELDNWKLGIIQNDWTDRVGSLLENEDFSGLRSTLTILCSTSSNESSHYSPRLGSSVFSHFFKLGLAGLADKTNASDKLSGNNDGQVSVTELKNFVDSEVTNYVSTQYGERQTPAFLNLAQGDDFILTWNLDSNNLAELQQANNLPLKVDLELLGECWNKLAALRETGALQFAPQSFSDWENRLLRAEKLAFEDADTANLRFDELRTELNRVDLELNPKGSSNNSSFVSKSNAFRGHELNIESGGQWGSLAMRYFFRDADEPQKQVAIDGLLSSVDNADQKAKINSLPIQDKFIASHLMQAKNLELWPVDTQLEDWLDIYQQSQQAALPADLRVVADIENSLDSLTQYCRLAFDYLLIGNQVSLQFDSIMEKAKTLTKDVLALSEEREAYYKKLDKAYSRFPYLAQWRLRTQSNKSKSTTLDRLTSVSFSPKDLNTFLAVSERLENEYQESASSLEDKQLLSASDIFEIKLILKTPLLKGNERRKLIEQLISFNPINKEQNRGVPTDSKDNSRPKQLTQEQVAKQARTLLSKLLEINDQQQAISQFSSQIRDSLLAAETAFPKAPENSEGDDANLVEPINFQRRTASLLTKFPTSESGSVDLIFVEQQNAFLTKLLSDASRNALLDLYGFPVGNVVERVPVFQQLVASYLKKLKRSPDFDKSELENGLNERIDLVERGLELTATSVPAIQSGLPDRVMVELTPEENEETNLYSTFPQGAMSLRFSGDNGFIKQGQAFELLPLKNISKFEMKASDTPLGLTAMFRGNNFTTRVLSEGFNGFTVDTNLKTPNTASVVLNGRLKARPSILFALDCSQSMANEIYVESIGDQMIPRLASARGVLKNLLNDFAQRGDSKIGIRLYGHRIGWSTDEPVKALTQDSYNGEFPDGIIPENDVELVLPIGRYTQAEHNRITKQLDTVRAWGQSPLYLTLRQAIKDFETGDEHENPSIVVITDGLNYQFTPGNEITFAAQKTELEDLLRDIKRLKENGKSIPIYIMGFGISAAEQSIAANEFRQIEEASGGKYFSFQNERDLARVLEEQLQLGSYEVTPILETAKTRYDNGYTKKLNEKITLNERGDYQLLIDGLAAVPFSVEGGESLQFFLGARTDGLSTIESLPYQTNVIAESELKSDDFLDVWKVRMHRFKPVDGGIEFNLSLQSQSNPFSPRPSEIWIELTPETEENKSSSASFSYFFYDRHFETSKNVPVMKLKAQGWNPQLAKRGNCEIFCKWEKTEPNFTRSFADFINNQNLINQRQSAPGIEGLEFEIEVDKVENAIKIKEYHQNKSGDDFDSEKPLWVRFDLTCESKGQPYEVQRRYNTKDKSAEHTFKFPSDSLQHFLDSNKSNIEIQTQKSLKQGAYKLGSGKMEFSLDDGQGLLPIDAATSDR